MSVSRVEDVQITNLVILLRRDASLLMLAPAFAVAACAGSPKSTQELEGSARQDVNRNLSAQGIYSLMESNLAQNIACGHVHVPDSHPRDLDFVYRDGMVILDDAPGFEAAARQCDAAARE